jgi:hypothetical protein
MNPTQSPARTESQRTVEVMRTRERENQYQIQKLGDANTPTLYWNRERGEWAWWEDSTFYTEAERTESLALHVAGKSNGFPDGGVWVVWEAAA